MSAFWTFVIGVARALSVPPVTVASMLVGRWPSGAPISRVPTGDVPSLGADEWANNHFVFDDNTRPSSLRPTPGYGGDIYPDAAADVLGTVCPHFAHVRKANPRDVATDFGKPADSLVRMILRRGIPFGPTVFTGGRVTKRLLEEERGLIFVSYGSTIEDQFEFLTRRWANSPVQPNAGGHDPIIGQVDDRGARKRHIDFPRAGGVTRVPIDDEWVVPTGGGYFFAPPIGAIRAVLGS